MSDDLSSRAYAGLLTSDPNAKVSATQQLRRDWEAGRLVIESCATAAATIADPGRPPRPVLVSPREVPQRPVHTSEGRAALIHALAHIEFNAINLALDAVYRFRNLPREYYGDWLKVAAEEAQHFTLLREHLRSLDYDYGDIPAHNGLWEMAQKTAHDTLHRMALVPRVLEARGLDASPAIMKKLAVCGDQRAVEILAIIQRDEVGHVAIGNRWYRYLCTVRGLDPIATFRELLSQYGRLRLRRPFDEIARRDAGFTEQEMQMLNELAT